MIRYPWPDSKLSSNGRTDRRYVTGLRQVARESGYWITKDSHMQVNSDLPLQMHMVFCPPDNRRRDDDNLITAFKSTRDGIFKALGIDDSRVRRLIVDRGEVTEDGAVYIEITSLTEVE